ncbi:MAG TPA: UDP-N-acetylmuramate dehydrogenase [Candidatus Limnocylindrales bacterium]|nr:UDP-N-acetylmuramate dehydrogenase [Candidatus Limnocylindrales bacterium]
MTGRLTPAEQLALGTDIQRRIGLKTSRDEPLARYTTMRVGGPADLFAEVHNLFELRAVARFARTRDVPLFLLGRGSDLVISDRGVLGLTVLVRAQGVRLEGQQLVAEAGLPMAKAATLAKEAGLSGLEFGLAIPGTVGGAVWANAGAHESEVAAVLASARVIDVGGEEQALDPAGLGLGYRDSRLKAGAPGQPAIVASATFQLEPAAPETIAARLDAIRRWRREHQPLGLPSAGSFFRNPASGPSAGALIDELGLKGHRVGGAVVSERHANFIVNDQHGSAADVRRLGEQVQAAVRRERGVELRFEAVFFGDWSDWEPAA